MTRPTTVALSSIITVLGAGCAASPAMPVGGTASGGKGMTAGATASGGKTGSGGSNGSGGMSAAPGTPDVRIEIRSDSDVHPISPLIYGTAAPDNRRRTATPCCARAATA